jgi:hypothetical protein
MPRVLVVKRSRWSLWRWRTGHGAPDGPVCTGQPVLACRILAITFSSELRFWWSYTFWKAYEILYIPELKPYQFEQIWHTGQSGVHRTSHMLLLFFQQFRLCIVGITFSSELRFWWSWTFWKAYKIIYISELKPLMCWTLSMYKVFSIWLCNVLYGYYNVFFEVLHPQSLSPIHFASCELQHTNTWKIH